MQIKTNYENLGVITKQLPSKLFETDKGSKIDGAHAVGDQVVREKTGKKKVHVFKAEDWRAMPATKAAAEKLKKASKETSDTTNVSEDKELIEELQTQNLQLKADKEQLEADLAQQKVSFETFKKDVNKAKEDDKNA